MQQLPMQINSQRITPLQTEQQPLMTFAASNLESRLGAILTPICKKGSVSSIGGGMVNTTVIRGRSWRILERVVAQTKTWPLLPFGVIVVHKPSRSKVLTVVRVVDEKNGVGMAQPKQCKY